MIRNPHRLVGLCVPVAAVAAVALASAAEPPSGRVETVVHEHSEMVVVPQGTFLMGPSADELVDLLAACRVQMGEGAYFCMEDWYDNTKLTERRVYLTSFAIDRYEVTAAEYRQCVAANACGLEALVAGDERYIHDRLPMVNVTWQDAVDYCTWAGKRLPTEAEWEKAARGTKGNRWPWGNHEREDGSNHGKGEATAMLYTHNLLPRGRAPGGTEFATDDSDGYQYAAPPGELRWSDSPYGAYDMAGNVAEWVQDYFHRGGYGDLPNFNPVRDDPDPSLRPLRVQRGGSWAEPRFFGRTYFRHLGLPEERSPAVGFRCASDV